MSCSFQLSFTSTLLLVWFFCITCFTPTVFATPQNVTIDDNQLDVVSYQPGKSWAFGPECHNCAAQPDVHQTVGETWHDTTFHGQSQDRPSVTIRFKGSAIYIYCIVPNAIPYVTTLVNMSFIIDGQPSTSYIHSPQPNGGFLYNVPVYVNTDLLPVEHVLVIQPNAETAPSLILFDYAVISLDDDDNLSTAITESANSTPFTATSSARSTSTGHKPDVTSTTVAHSQSASSASSVGTIVGAALGAAVGTVCFVALGLALWLRRRRRDDALGTQHASTRLSNPHMTYAALEESRESSSHLPKLVQRYLERQPFNTNRGRTGTLGSTAAMSDHADAHSVNPPSTPGPFSIRGLEPRRRPLPHPELQTRQPQPALVTNHGPESP